VAAKTNVKLDQAAIRRMGARANGPVMTDMERRRRNVTRKARQLAPPGMKRFLKGGIITRNGRQVLTVDNTHPAAIFVIKGTKKHIIRPKKKGGVLVFNSKGTKVFARIVHHPGTKPNDFMSRALREAKR
jgi:hypothetical protein